MDFEEFMVESPEVRARMQKQTDKLRKDFAKSNVGTGLATAAQIMHRKAPTAIFTAADPTADGTLDAAKKQGLYKENKSGDSSLHDWFNKSKASDGTKGWVQLGGKYAGKPCAKQPGQTTKPKCGSSKMKRDLNKDEEQAAFRRKNRQDPDPNRSGKAKNVATEGKTYEGFMSENIFNKIGNEVKYAAKQLAPKQKLVAKTPNPFRNNNQDVSKAGKFQDTAKVVKAFSKNTTEFDASKRKPMFSNMGTSSNYQPPTQGMRGRA